MFVLIKFICWVFLIFYVLRIAFRWGASLLLKRLAGHAHNQQTSRKEGEISVEGERKNTTQSYKDKGEYVDYEEID